MQRKFKTITAMKWRYIEKVKRILRHANTVVRLSEDEESKRMML